jgi:hypothetical protein
VSKAETAGGAPDEPASPGLTGPGAMPADDERVPGLGAQFGRTRASFSRLFRAHVDLAKAEIGEIVDQLKMLAALAGVVFVLALLVGNLLYVGGFLFLGEWLFGSMGWGLAHGVLLGVALIVALGLGIVGASRGAAVTSFLVALALAIVLALVMGSNIAYDTSAAVGTQLVSPLNSPGMVAGLSGVIIGAVIFAVLLWRVGGGGGAAGGLLLGVLLGGILGWLIGGAPWTWPPAVGLAITVGLLAWPILNVIVAWPQLDPAERFARLKPQQSIEAANETRAWLEEQWRNRRPTPGRK